MINYFPKNCTTLHFHQLCEFLLFFLSTEKFQPLCGCVIVALTCISLIIFQLRIVSLIGHLDFLCCEASAQVFVHFLLGSAYFPHRFIEILINFGCQCFVYGLSFLSFLFSFLQFRMHDHILFQSKAFITLGKKIISNRNIEKNNQCLAFDLLNSL